MRVATAILTLIGSYSCSVAMENCIAKESTSPTIVRSPRTGIDLAKIVDLHHAVPATDSRSTTHDDRLRIIDQIAAVYENCYVHRRLKEKRHGANVPLELARIRKEASSLSDVQFHDAMKAAVITSKDRHTRYCWEEMGNWTAILGVKVRHAGDPARYIVSQVSDEVKDDHFRVGAIVTHWNGTPISVYIRSFARRLPSGNDDGALAQAQEYLTLRPLKYLEVPTDEWVTLSFESAGEKLDKQLQWKALQIKEEFHRGEPVDVDFMTTLASDECLALAEAAEKVLFRADEFDREAQLKNLLANLSEADRNRQLATRGESVSTEIEHRFVGSEQAQAAYVRIKSFMGEPSQSVAEFVRILRLAEGKGLVLDVRGNPGGQAFLAEMFLQTLFKQPIEPQRFQFLSTQLNQTTCNNNIFNRYLRSVTKSHELGDWYSAGFPIEGSVSNMKQEHSGPMVLVIDGLTFSSAEVFAAGFQDHRLGRILGAGAKTSGGGGANVWFHRFFRLLHPEFTIPADLATALANPKVTSDVRNAFAKHAVNIGESATVQARDQEWILTDGSSTFSIRKSSQISNDLLVYSEDGRSRIRSLPKSVGLEFALRRSNRVHDSLGVAVEDLGVEADAVHQYTTDDVLHSDRDLLQAALALLAKDRNDE